MSQNFNPILASSIFLTVNILILWVILQLNRQTESNANQNDRSQPEEDNASQGQKFLAAADILGWEFEYARTTASEAMRDRHTMINFYLLIVGILASGVLAALGGDTNLPNVTETVLLWLLCGIGWLYFLKLIRLRQAWRDSAKTMNRIKDFYIQRAKEFDQAELRQAFRWQSHTLPAPDKPWTIFFYSAMLIGLLDSVAYVAGGALLDLEKTLSLPGSERGLLIVLGLAFFAFHVWLYFAFLREPDPAASSQDQ
jgi:hypothetical protein